MAFDPVEHLRRQLQFLENSSRSFDMGFKDEAIRIATVLRVMFHQTPASTSLMTHLGNQPIRLLSTVAQVHPAAVMFHGMAPMKISPSSVEYYPNLGNAPFKYETPFDAWWNQPIFILNGVTATRRTTVLGAANKDGGAHVDPNLTTEFEYVIGIEWVAFRILPETRP